MQAFEHQLHGRGQHCGRCAFVRRSIGCGGNQRLGGNRQSLVAGEQLHVGLRAEVVAGVHHLALAEAGNHVAQLVGREAVLEHFEHGRPQHGLDDLAVLPVGHRLDLDLAGGGAHERFQVADPGHDVPLAPLQRPASGVGRERLGVGDGHAHRHARALVDLAAGTGHMAEGGHDLGHEVGQRHDHALAHLGQVQRAGLRRRDVHLGVDIERVMGAYLGAEAVLQRRDDAAAVGVVLGVGGGHQQHVERQADLVAADLHVAFLEHVQQAHLDPLGQVGQFVDGEDAAVGARHQAVVQRQLVGQVPALGHLDRVDLADEVGDRRVRRGQLLAVANAAMRPGNRGVVAVLGNQIERMAGHGVVGVVEDLRALDVGHPLVEQVHQRADHAGLGLAPLSQEHHVVAGQHGVLELGQHGVLVAQHSFEQRLGCGDGLRGIRTHLLLDRPGDPADLAQFAERGGLGHGGQPTRPLRYRAGWLHGEFPARSVTGGGAGARAPREWI